MSRDDDYLWDPAGTPDPAVRRLESALAPLPGPPAPPRWPEPDRRPTWLGPRFLVPLAAAAVLTLTLGGAWMRAQREGWNVRALEGRPRVTGWAGRFARLRSGGEVITRPGERARVAVRDIGWIELEANSRLRLMHTGPGRDRLALARGEMRAVIAAPPRTFVVDTPSGVATDLGCAYRLRVGEQGDGDLSVTAGWVAFTHAGRESFVPAGAMCRTRPALGPGTPRFEDAPSELVAALDAFDASAGVDSAALSRALSAARPRDALTLWHLLARVRPEQRPRVADRLAEFVPLPAGASREGILNLERESVDAWWDALGFGSSAFWRRWKGEYPGAPVESGETAGDGPPLLPAG